VKLSAIHPNPKNPRTIKDDRFKKMVASIKEFPAMMELRPIVVDKDGMILGGNMRYKAIKELGMKEIPDNWVKSAEGLTEDEQKRFIVEDNLQFGGCCADCYRSKQRSKPFTAARQIGNRFPYSRQ